MPGHPKRSPQLSFLRLGHDEYPGKVTQRCSVLLAPAHSLGFPTSMLKKTAPRSQCTSWSPPGLGVPGSSGAPTQGQLCPAGSTSSGTEVEDSSKSQLPGSWGLGLQQAQTPYPGGSTQLVSQGWLGWSWVLGAAGAPCPGSSSLASDP